MKNISIFGIGKLGLGFSLLLDKSGYNVLGIDVFQEYVDSLNNKTFQSTEPEYTNLLKNNKYFEATIDINRGLTHSDIIFILVQTPNGGGDKFYDHSILSNLLIKINKLKPENKHLIIGCTIMPNYINQIGNTLLENTNCTLSYNPEFIAQGEIVKGFLNPDIILIGTENTQVKIELTEIYNNMTKTNPKFCIMTPLEAEIVKISLNGFITTKLSFANMISDFCDKAGACKTTVLNAIGNDSRIGNKYFKPGYSFGGPCFPRDTQALAQCIKSYNMNTDILYATSLYNEIHIDEEVNRLIKENKEIYTISNVCYKENCNIPIIEESAKLKIAKKLVENNKKVIIQDNIQIIQEVKKDFGNLFNYSTV